MKNITNSDIKKIEDIFGIRLYEWQKDYLLDRADCIRTGRGNGKQFAYCIKLLLSDGEKIKKSDLIKYADKKPRRYGKWFIGYCLDINEKLVNAGFETRIEV